jgi:divinyl protochlorophyllide a 8-vinyl-reductase
MIAHAHPVGRIGPNVLIQTAHALAHRLGRDTASRVLQVSTHHTFDTLPTEMVDEATANALMRHLVTSYGLPFARTVMRDAGERTGDYLLANRIPGLARMTLPALPSRLALRILLSAISRHTWTFAGSARVEILHGAPAMISLSRCPMCAGITSDAPICDFYVGTFHRLAQALLGPRGFAEEVTCEARGDSACRFAMGTRP